MDENTIFHAYTILPLKVNLGGQVLATFIVYPSIETMNEGFLSQTSIQVVNEADKIVIFLCIQDNVLRHRALLETENGNVECLIKFIPARSELYSRSKGLLETSLLAEKTVGIVGLGSGGSPLAVELAKAGVGQFTLIDFDRLELSNISRHVCGINDLGRYKTYAVRDSILQKNPYAKISTLEIDVNKARQLCEDALAKVDIIMCASDNDRSRFFLNEISLKYKITAVFGRAITRAVGGDVLRVRPYNGPCYSCLYSQNIRPEGGDDEEISQLDQAKELLPDYTSEADVKSAVQVGLSSDITPISNFMVKLALVELSRGANSGIKSLEEDFISDFYIWANRRENVYENWSKLEFNFNKPSILRWYGAKVERDPKCMVCGQ